MVNKRWRRVKRGKFGRVSLLWRAKYGRNQAFTGWCVQYWYLDGVGKCKEFGDGIGSGLKEALKSQRRFLAGGKP